MKNFFYNIVLFTLCISFLISTTCINVHACNFRKRIPCDDSEQVRKDVSITHIQNKINEYEKEIRSIDCNIENELDMIEYRERARKIEIFKYLVYSQDDLIIKNNLKEFYEGTNIYYESLSSKTKEYISNNSIQGVQSFLESQLNEIQHKINMLSSTIDQLRRDIDGLEKSKKTYYDRIRFYKSLL